MNRVLILSILMGIVSSCGGGKGDPPEPENKPPSIPLLASPVNNLLCTNNELDFLWEEATDPEGDDINYEIQVAKDLQFADIVHELNTASTSQSITLEKGMPFYWRVRAVDSKNAESDYSAIFQLYTEGEGIVNHLPFSPILVSPAINATEQNATTTLEWTATDVDNDPLTFYIYFGVENPPVNLVSENQTGNTFEASLSDLTTYYWRVEVLDDKGGKTIGQVWTFKTD
jgi:hypothetical protein